MDGLNGSSQCGNRETAAAAAAARAVDPPVPPMLPVVAVPITDVVVLGERQGVTVTRPGASTSVRLPATGLGTGTEVRELPAFKESSGREELSLVPSPDRSLLLFFSGD